MKRNKSHLTEAYVNETKAHLAHHDARTLVCNSVAGEIAGNERYVIQRYYIPVLRRLPIYVM